jgi:hypothetical protein
MAFDLVNVFNITDAANLELNGAINPLFAKVDGTPLQVMVLSSTKTTLMTTTT